MNNNLVNNTISCYKRPRINYYMNSKSKNKRKTIKEKSFNYNNKENININNININLNTVQKKPNFFRIYKNNKEEISLSKNIAFLCGVINSINNSKINNNNIKELIKEKNNNKNIIKNKYIIKVIKIQKWWRIIYKDKIPKIKLIQKQWKQYMKNRILNDYYFFSFKKLISSTKNNTTKASTINSNANLLKSFQEETEKEKEKEIIYINIRKKFISYITQKFSKFFILILNKLNLFNFIKILSQRINKSINQYVFYIIYNNKKENNNINDTNNKIFFFEAIERHLKVNLNMDENNINEIAILLRTNIPKYFMEKYNRNYLPFINSFQEKNLLNTQLFLYNNEKLINYILFFLSKEKGEKFDEEKNIRFRNYIKKDLNLRKLKNRNIFGIMRYINILKKYFEKENNLYSKLKIMPYKESYHSENIKEDNSSNNEFEDEDNYGNVDNNIDIKKFRIKFHYMDNNE